MNVPVEFWWQPRHRVILNALCESYPFYCTRAGLRMRVQAEYRRDISARSVAGAIRALENKGVIEVIDQRVWVKSQALAAIALAQVEVNS